MSVFLVYKASFVLQRQQQEGRKEGRKADTSEAESNKVRSKQDDSFVYSGASVYTAESARPGTPTVFDRLLISYRIRILPTLKR
jgi:hypothetical protein